MSLYTESVANNFVRKNVVYGYDVRKFTADAFLFKRNPV